MFIITDLVIGNTYVDEAGAVVAVIALPGVIGRGGHEDGVQYQYCSRPPYIAPDATKRTVTLAHAEEHWSPYVGSKAESEAIHAAVRERAADARKWIDHRLGDLACTEDFDRIAMVCEALYVECVWARSIFAELGEVISILRFGCLPEDDA